MYSTKQIKKQAVKQMALANTVYAAAQYIDRLETLLPVVKQIADNTQYRRKSRALSNCRRVLIKSN